MILEGILDGHTVVYVNSMHSNPHRWGLHFQHLCSGCVMSCHVHHTLLQCTPSVPHILLTFITALLTTLYTTPVDYLSLVDLISCVAVLPLRVTKASDIVLPSPGEVDLAILAFLEDHPLSVVHVALHLEWFDTGAARVYGVDSRHGAASLVHLSAVTGEPRALGGACGGESQS